MMKQSEHYQQFKWLHEQPEGFIMPNPWDGASALLMKHAGFKALGTSSAAIALALGRQDGRHAVTLEEHLTNARLLIEIADLPVNGDLEDGFGPEPNDVEATVKAAIDAGLAGVGIEDTTANPDSPIHEFDKAVARVKAAAAAAKGKILLTGRTDNFLQGRPDVDDTIKRLVAFAEVGADVLYAPYPGNMDQVRAIVRAVAPKPVNLVVGTMAGTLPWSDVKAAGVKRLSLGAALYTRVMGSLAQAAVELMKGDLAAGSGEAPSTSTGYKFGQLQKMMGDVAAKR
jgi:2-methylisocitrate lyase-like PEP mutase family enzyme